MNEPQTVHACRWGLPTLLLPWPFWYAAADDAWSCTCNGMPRILHDPAVCAACRRWEPRREQEAAAEPPHARCGHYPALIYRSDELPLAG